VINEGSVTIETADEMRDLARSMAAWVRAGDVVVLSGPLGAGKTTWTQGFAEGLGVRGAVTSPTFVIARSHPSITGGPALIHVDAYRVGDALEFDDLDLVNDQADSVTVVEWGAGHTDRLSAQPLLVTIERSSSDDASEQRRVSWHGRGARWHVPLPSDS